MSWYLEETTGRPAAVVQRVSERLKGADQWVTGVERTIKDKAGEVFAATLADIGPNAVVKVSGQGSSGPRTDGTMGHSVEIKIETMWDFLENPTEPVAEQPASQSTGAQEGQFGVPASAAPGDEQFRPQEAPAPEAA